ncbi:MAG: hypothetical protein DRP82_06205 [Planctomycetota bacterium]|nr:MAG: hypothetical protein DRP82_06205 [Planctomycetota bacterium]
MEALGLYQRGDELISVVMERRRGGFRAVWVGCESFKSASEEAEEEAKEEKKESPFTECVRRLLGRRRTSYAVAVMPAKIGLVREVVLGLTKDDHIRATVPFEAARLMAEGKPEDFVVDFHRMGEADGKSRVLIVAMEKERVRQWIEAMQAGGVNPRKVDVDVACAYNAALACGYSPSQKREVLFCFAGGMVYLFLHNEGTLQRVRALFAGEGERRVERLVREAKRTAVAAGIDVGFERVVVCGDTGGIEDALAARLNAEVERVDLTPMAEGLDDEGKRLFMRGGYVAAGGAIKMLGYDALRLDLRRGELAFMRPFERLKSGLACMVTLLFFICLILAYALQFRYSRNSAALAKLKELAREYFYAAFGADEKPLVPGIRRHATTVEEYAKAFAYVIKRRKKGMRVEEGRVSALDVLVDFAAARGRAARKVKATVLLDSISISPRQARIKVTCDKVEIGPQIAEYLLGGGRTGFVLDGEPKSGSEKVKKKVEGGQVVEEMRYWYEYTLKPKKERKRGRK